MWETRSKKSHLTSTKYVKCMVPITLNCTKNQALFMESAGRPDPTFVQRRNHPISLTSDTCVRVSWQQRTVHFKALTTPPHDGTRARHRRHRYRTIEIVKMTIPTPADVCNYLPGLLFYAGRNLKKTSTNTYNLENNITLPLCEKEKMTHKFLIPPTLVLWCKFLEATAFDRMAPLCFRALGRWLGPTTNIFISLHFRLPIGEITLWSHVRTPKYENRAGMVWSHIRVAERYWIQFINNAIYNRG